MGYGNGYLRWGDEISSDLLMWLVFWRTASTAIWKSESREAKQVFWLRASGRYGISGIRYTIYIIYMCIRSSQHKQFQIPESVSDCSLLVFKIPTPKLVRKTSKTIQNRKPIHLQAHILPTSGSKGLFPLPAVDGTDPVQLCVSQPSSIVLARFLRWKLFGSEEKKTRKKHRQTNITMSP